MSVKKILKNYFYEYYSLELDNYNIEEIMHIVADDFISLIDENWTLLNRYMDEQSISEKPYSFPEFIIYLKRNLTKLNERGF